MAKKNADNSELDAGLDDLLAGGWDNIPEAKQLPLGTWKFKASALSYKAGKEGKSPTVTLVAVPVAAGDDVDADALAELGADYNPAEMNRIFHRIWISETSDWSKVKNVLRVCGLDPADYAGQGGITQSFKDIRNRTFQAYVEPDSFQRGDETVYGNKLTAFSPDA